MADNVLLNSGSGGETLASDDIGGVQHQRVKVQHGADGSATDTSHAAPLPIEGGDAENAAITANPVAVGGRYDASPRTLGDGDLGAIALDADGAVHVSDGGNALTVDLGSNNDVTVEGGAVLGTDGNAGPANALSVGGTESGGTFQELRVDGDGHLQVDVLSGGGGGTQYTEDDAAAANPVGTANALVRQDTPAGLTSADGDVVAQRGTDYGAAYVQVVDSSGNFVNSFGGSGGTSHADDAAFSIGSASSLTPMGALADETTPDSVDEGDVGVPRMTLDRKLLTRVVGATDGNRMDVDASGHAQVDIAASSATVTVTDDGSFTLAANSGVDIGDVDVTSVVPGTGATNLGKAEDAAHTTGDTGVMALAVRNDTIAALAGTDGDYAPLQVNADGALYVHDANLVSTSNSTTSTLANDATYEGTGEDVSQYAAVTVTMDASHDSAASGLSVEFSTDNTNWDDAYTWTYSSADGARRFQFPVTAQYFRIVYTNGGTTQTHFRLQTILHSQPVTQSVHRVGDTVTEDRSTTVVKAVQDSTISTGNSRSAATLNGGSTFTGSWEDVHRFAEITCLIDTTTASKTGTLKLQFSMDGSTLHRDIQLSSVDPATEAPHTLIPVAQYFRIEYVADGTSPADDLASFTIQTIYHGAKSKGLTSRVNATINDNTDVQVGRSVIAAYNGSAYQNVQSTAGGNLKVSLQEASDGLDIGAGNAGTETLRVSIATDDVNLSGILADTAAIQAAVEIMDDWDETNRAAVNTIAGQVGVQGGAGAATALTQRVTVATDDTVTVDLGANNDVTATGNVAHDAADSGAPVKIGAKAVNIGATPTAVAASDRTDILATRYGQLFTLGGHPNVTRREYQGTTAQTNDAIIDSIAAGNRIVITEIEVVADNANTADTKVRIGFGATAVPTEPADGASVDGMVLAHTGVAAGSGIVAGNGSGIVAVGGDGEELRITTSGADPNIKVLVTFFTYAA